MMSLSNSNVLYIPVPPDSSNGLNMVQEMGEPQGQGQFPTYNASATPQPRIQVLAGNEKALDDTTGRSPSKQLAGTSSSKNVQQMYSHKNEMSNDNSLILPRGPGMEDSHRPPSQESPGNSRSIPTDGHVVHHHQGNPVAGSSSYTDSTSYSQQQHQHQQQQHQQQQHQQQQHQQQQQQHREVPRSPSQRHHQEQTHDSSGRVYHQHSSKKSHIVHEMPRQHQGEKKPRAPHMQNADKKVYVYESSHGPIIQSDHQHQHQQHQVYHQQGEKKHYERSPQAYHHGEPKSKHSSMRAMQREARVMQQHGGEHKSQQQIRETMYHLGEQKSQKIHYQHSGDGKQIHLTSRPMYHHPSDQQKSPQIYDAGQQMQHQHDPKSQHEVPRSHSHSEHKKQQETQHNEHKNQHEQQQQQQSGQQQHADSHKKQSQDSSSRSSSSSNEQKGQQKNVHRYNHGNARVKYVEFKPIQQQEGVKYRQVPQQSHQQQQQHAYNSNSKQMLYYANHVSGSAVQAPHSQPQMSPLHSPPALRPPPTLPSGAAWHSPPSLVPSPEVRPRFDFNNSPQPATTSGSPHPVQVSNMVHHKTYSGNKSTKQVNVPAGQHNILVPRVPGGFLASPGHQAGHGNMVHANVIPRSKGNVIQHPTPASNSTGTQPVYEAAQSGIAASSVATTVTVTMTYIPIPTSAKDKVLYFPVANSGQPVMLYQSQQGGSKPMILPQQMIHQGRMPTPKDGSKDPGAYTAVRLVNPGVKTQNSAVMVTSHTSPMKNLKYHFANPPMAAYPGTPHPKKSPGFVKLDHKTNMGMIDLEKEKHSLMASNSKEFKEDGTSKGEMMTLISSQLRLVPPQVGVNSQSTVTGAKRNNMGVTMVAPDSMQSPGSLPKKPAHEELMMTIPNNVVRVPQLDKKKLTSKPPKAEKIPRKSGKKKPKEKGQDSLLTVFSEGKTNANEALIEAYKKQQQVLLQKHYFEEPLLSLPDLPPTPETWSMDDVHKYLLSTDCSAYADAIKAEEIDGKSFLLLTHEALMDFLGVKFGPALKIAGHAANLRARQRVYCIMENEQHISAQQQLPAPSKEKKMRIMSPNKTIEVKQPTCETTNRNATVHEKSSTCAGNPTTITSAISNNSINDCSLVNKNESILSPPMQRNHQPPIEKNHSSMVDNLNSSMTELIIPNISHLTSPVLEKKERPQLQPPQPPAPPPPISELSPVVLKVPNPMSLILGQNQDNNAAVRAPTAKPVTNMGVNGIMQDSLAPSPNNIANELAVENATNANHNEKNISVPLMQDISSAKSELKSPVPMTATSLQANIFPNMVQQNMKPLAAVAPNSQGNLYSNMVQNMPNDKFEFPGKLLTPATVATTPTVHDVVHPSMVQKPISATSVATAVSQDNVYSNMIQNSAIDKFELPAKPLTPATMITVPNLQDGLFQNLLQKPLTSTAYAATSNPQNNLYSNMMQNITSDKFEFPSEPLAPASMVTTLHSQNEIHPNMIQKLSGSAMLPATLNLQGNVYPSAMQQNIATDKFEFPTKSNLLQQPSTSMVAPATTSTHLQIPTLTEIEPDGSHQNS